MKERDLYEPVRDFIESEFNCFHTAIEKGSKDGKIDVIGLRNTIGDLGGHTEVISVEVKPEKNTYLKSVGQAYAYSVMADRCFLAVHKPYNRDFTQQEKDQALKIGVGLIKIGSHKECSIVSSSPIHTPLSSHKLSLLNKLGFVQCVMCNSLFKDKGMRNLKERSSITNAIRENKPFRYWLWGLSEQKEEEREYVYDRRHICADCVQVFGGLIDSKKS